MAGRPKLTLDPAQSISAEDLAKMLAVDEEFLGEGQAFIGQPTQGRYPMDFAIRGAIAWLVEERDYISNKELAELQGITPSRVSNQVKDGILHLDSRGKYPRREAIHELLSHYRTRIGEGKTTAGAAKNQSLQLGNRLLEIQVAKAEGRAIDRDVVEKSWANLILTCREKLLRLANKVAPRIPYLKSESEIEGAIDLEVRECLSELARPPEYITEETSGSAETP